MVLINVSERLSGLLALFFICGLFSVSNADTVSALSSLRGRVLDQNSAAIPGAKVVATASHSPSSVSAVTDQNGDFSLVLEPGEYTLRISVDGFSDATQIVRLSQGSNPFL